MAYTNKEEFDKAFADFNSALQLAPNGVRIYFNRAFTYFRKNEIDKAIDELHHRHSP